MKITVQEDYENAPKKGFIKEFCIANAKANIPSAIDMLTDDVRLEIPGYKSAQGKEEVQKLLVGDANRSQVTELLIESIITHGDKGAANGILTFADGGVVAFCNMYTFNSHSKDPKLKRIQAYSIVL